MIHITGTNGKGSTARMVTALLVAQGLSVGTYTSPHLERINERMAWNDEPICDDEFAETIRCVADLEPLLGQGAIGRPRPTSRSSPRPRTGGSPTSRSTWRSSRSGWAGAGTPPTWPTARSPS